MCLWHLVQFLYQIKKKKKKPSDHKHVLPQTQTEATAAQHACLPPSLILSVSTHPSLELPSCPTHWILIPACHVFFSFFLSTSPLFYQTLAAYLVITRVLRKTLSFKGLAIISVEHNKMASPQEEGEVWAAVRRCMSHRLALEVGAEVEVL